MADMNSSSAGTRGLEERTGSTSTAQERQGNGDSSSGGFIGKVRERANAELSTQKDRAIDGLGSAARAVRQSTQQLREQDHGTVASYVEGAADQIERFSQRLREKDVGELLEDVQRLARRQPAWFVGSAFALGLLGARFLKSSREEDEYGSGRYGRRASGAQRTRPAGGWRTGMGTSPGRTGMGRATETGASRATAGSAGDDISAARGTGQTAQTGRSGSETDAASSSTSGRATEGYTSPGASRGRRGGTGGSDRERT
jgi:hypothetical protein